MRLSVYMMPGLGGWCSWAVFSGTHGVLLTGVLMGSRQILGEAHIVRMPVSVLEENDCGADTSAITYWYRIFRAVRGR